MRILLFELESYKLLCENCYRLCKLLYTHIMKYYQNKMISQNILKFKTSHIYLLIFLKYEGYMMFIEQNVNGNISIMTSTKIYYLIS